MYIDFFCFKIELRTTGIWVPWNTKNSTVPKYAVDTGTDKTSTLYVMRAQVKYNGGIEGILVGKFAVSRNEASVGWNYEIFVDAEIEVKTLMFFHNLNFQYKPFTDINSYKLSLGCMAEKFR
jgi:hypothetical protein